MAKQTSRKRKKRKLSPLGRIVVVLMFVIPVVLIIIFGVLGSFRRPKPLKADYDNAIVIEDGLHIMENEASLRAALTEFRDKTGITPAVVTTHNSAWIGNYNTMDTYVYDEYLNRFTDEKHWLIVFSASIEEDQYSDWYWEEKAGEKTASLLKEKNEEDFRNDLNEKLMQLPAVSVDSAIAEVLSKSGEEMMKRRTEWPVFFLSIAGIVVFLGVMFLNLAIRNKKNHEA